MWLNLPRTKDFLNVKHCNGNGHIVSFNAPNRSERLSYFTTEETWAERN